MEVRIQVESRKLEARQASVGQACRSEPVCSSSRPHLLRLHLRLEWPSRLLINAQLIGTCDSLSLSQCQVSSSIDFLQRPDLHESSFAARSGLLGETERARKLAPADLCGRVEASSGLEQSRAVPSSLELTGGAPQASDKQCG